MEGEPLMMRRKILIPIKNTLQEKADEYAMKQDCQTLQGMTRIESLSDGYILFIYANFSITCIRELPNGKIRIDDYRNTNSFPKESFGHTVSDHLREKWYWEGVAHKAEKPMTYAKHDKVIKKMKNIAFNW